MNLPYLKQECELTLKEGLEFHYSMNPTFRENTRKAPVFYNHDLAHVLFGLNTTIEHEAIVDFRCMFSTNWGIKKYTVDYFKDPESIKIIKSIIKEAGYIKSIFGGFKSTFKIIKVLFDSNKMSKKWKINPDERLLNARLSDLRNEYNIKVIN